MTDNLEIVMDIETLEIFEVISSDDNSKDLTPSEEVIEKVSEEKKSSHNNHYSQPSSLLWKVDKDGVIHELSPRNKHGTYPYHQYVHVPGKWGHVSQLTQEEALWLTLEFNPELMSYV
ncbi:hypothetical protein [Streptococcus gallolyticus]|uniref:hypothetical protein n=1 Tax=Streptococcus gallolyticus TaxID=315405 RepID=UPI003D2FECAF